MKRAFLFVVAMAAVSAFAITSLRAGDGDGCSASKSKVAAAAGSCSSADSCCSKQQFPTMTTKVGEKTYECPIEAKQAAEKSKAKVVYAVCGKSYDTQDEATKALADASECYLSKFTQLACLVDGKVMYCDDDAECSKTKKVAAKDECCLSKSKDGKAVAAKTGECPKVCEKEEAAKKVAAKEGSSSCKSGDAKDAKTVAAKEGSACCKSGAAKDAKAVASKEDSAHCKSGAAKDAKAVAAKEGSACCKSGAAKDAKAVASKDCSEGKNVKFLVAGRTFDKKADAEKAREQVLVAVHKVKMKYVVDGKEIENADEVCPMAKKEGKVRFVVGVEKIECEFTARIKLAKAQFEAAKSCAIQTAKM